MVKKIVKIAIGLILLIVCFVGSIAVRDRWRENHLQANKGKITVGMSEAEVISILGEPTSKHMSDIPGLYWCYGSDTWREWAYNDEYCGNTLLEMSSGGRVVRAPH